ILATPDISVKDLVGQIDVVKIIKKGIEVFDIDSYSPGYLLQARYGILCLDELPVLDPRKQVTLLSVLQEGRFTTGAYPVFFKPDVKIIATANPIDYTHSGKIIEPLADRLKSHIETHYPNTIDDETLILVQEMDMLNRNQTFLPIFMLKAITRIFQKIRTHPDINSDRGVSVRSTIHSLEAVIGEVERVRSLVNNVKTIPRFSDLQSIFQSSKFELDEIEDTTENKTLFLNNVINEVIQETCLHFFNEFFKPQELISIKNEFRNKSFIVVQNQYQHLPTQPVDDGEGTKLAKESRDTSFLYTDQLRHLPVISKTLRGVIAKIKQEQDNFVQKARQNEIDRNLQYIQFENVWNDKENNNEELLATSSELLFEYLRFSSPPILDKREDRFEIRE
ncbi:MAG: sigma 54-interacting transcriptional regulator, partial [Thermoproteota archaeon]|nr:sigma 54-interacting transcriptional regulator [Thermoproteota archaeon]